MYIQKFKNWLKAREILRVPLRKYYFLRYLRKYAKKKIQIPRAVYIETTSHCNARCEMCPHEKMKREKGHMSMELFKKIIDECRSFEGPGLQIVLHKDGEPLLDPLLFERIKYAKQVLQRSEVCLNSNAALLDEKNAGQLLDSGIDSITFSVDGATAGTYEKIRTGLKYDIVKENLERFFRMKEKSLKKPRVIVQMVVNDDNKHEIEEYKRLWLEKADEIYFKAMHSFLDMGTSIKTKIVGSEQLGICEQPYNFMMIYWNGDVGLCCWDYDNMAGLGNVSKDKLLTVYNNEKFRAVRAAMNAMDCAKIGPCNKCAVIYGRDLHRSFEWERKLHH